MSSKLMMPKLAISALCLALLSACGGDDGPSMFDDSETGKPGFTGTDKSKIKLPVVDRISKTPLIHEFVSTENGQQLSPTVVRNDDNNNGRIDSTDRIHFKAPGIVSGICGADGCGSPKYAVIKRESEKLQANITTAKDAVKDKQKALTLAEAELERAKNSPSSTAGGTKDPIAEAQKKVDDASFQLEQSKNELEEATKAFNASKLPAIDKDQQLIMEDVNGDHHTVHFIRTIDINNIPANYNYPDAGIVKRDLVRTRTDSGYTDTKITGIGSGDRKFNRVLVFGKDNSSFTFNKENGTSTKKGDYYLDAYFRHPAAAGWSYQTFGNFHSNSLSKTRGLNIGYQSIGKPTKTGELPKDGYAVYEGIAHAYYNKDQVTMHNEINANFSKRRLTYKTSETAIYHTFEGPEGEGSEGNIHVIEYRPELNLTGEARWNKGVSEFKGHIKSENGLEGRLEGRFYGPQAAEVGGVFGLQGTVDNEVVQYVGGFGASRE